MQFKFWSFRSGIVIMLVCLYSCHNADKEKGSADEKYQKTSFDVEEVRELKKRVLSGDTAAYYDLRYFYVTNNNGTDFLLWAMIMANKYNFQTAYHDVFFCVQDMNTVHGEYSTEKRNYSNILDSTTINFSKEYLNKMSDKGFVKRVLNSYFKDSVQ